MTRVAIVVVTYNSVSEIGCCLDAIASAANESPDLQIVVVDNASSDGTRQKVLDRGIPLIANSGNAGFAAAVNQGVRATTAPLVLLLNPDAILEAGLTALVAEFNDPRVAAAGGLLIGANGLPQRGFMTRSLPTPVALIFEVLGINSVWKKNPVNWHYRCLGLDPVTPGFVEQPAGAFFMFSRGIWEKVGGFDERFWPIWFEDVDFCQKIKQAGYLVRFNPAAVARHTGAHSAGTLPLEIRERYWYGSLLEYAARHFRPTVFRSVCAAAIVGSVLRAVRGYPRIGFKAVAVCITVCRLAAGRMVSPR